MHGKTCGNCRATFLKGHLAVDSDQAIGGSITLFSMEMPQPAGFSDRGDIRAVACGPQTA
jgi:hypothetical protein